MQTLFVTLVIAVLVTETFEKPVPVGSVPCDFPHAPKFPAKPQCAPTTLSTQNATALAWQFAPELRFHQLENSYPMDPTSYFEQAALFVPAFLLSEANRTDCDSNNITCRLTRAEWRQHLSEVWKDNPSVAMWLHKSWMSVLDRSDLSAEEIKEIVRGDPFDAQDRSTASVAHTFYPEQDGNAWVFNYHVFYGWNGCSNQLLSTKLEKTYDVLEYYMCPEGIHETDWEHVGVYVCPADLEKPGATPRDAIRRVHYSQHGWVQEYDCEEGECPFEDDALSKSQLVAYPGLFSHAHYPAASPLWVYAQGRLTFLFNMDGIFIGDRTGGNATHGRRWVPTAQNVRYLPPAEDIPDNSSDVWGLYTGNWGAFHVDSVSSKRSITCLYDNQTREGDCSEEERDSFSLALLTDLLGFNDASNTSDALQFAVKETIESANRTDSNAGRTGPLQRDYSYTWLPERAAPIWDAAQKHNRAANSSNGLIAVDFTCPASQPLNEADWIPEEFSSSDVLTILWGILGATLASTIIVSLLLLLPSLLWQGARAYNMLLLTMAVYTVAYQASGSKGVKTAAEAQGSIHTHPAARELAVVGLGRPAIFSLIALVMLIAGVVMIGLGIDDLFDALNAIYSWSTWDSFKGLIITLLVILSLIDVIIAVLIILASPSRLPSRRGCSGKSSAFVTRANMLAICVGFLTLQIYTTLILYAFGFLLVIARQLLNTGCITLGDLTQNAFDGAANICIDLSAIGLKTVACGSDIVRFCNSWEDVRVQYILWGSYLFMFSHLLFMLVCLHISTILRMMHTVFDKGAIMVQTAMDVVADPKSSSHMEESQDLHTRDTPYKDYNNADGPVADVV